MSNPSADRPSTDTSSAEVDRERLGWRARMLGGVSWAVVVAASLTTVWYIVVDRNAPQMIPALLGFTIVSVANAVGRRLPYLLRTGVLLASLFAIGAYAVAVGGFAPNAVLALSVVTVTATLLLGRRAGLVATLLGAGALLAAALGHRSGALARAPQWAANIDSTDLANTLRVTAVFALLSGTLVIAVSYLLTRSEQLAVEKARSLARLEHAQAEKERIARDLELREATFRKAQELELLGRLAGSMAHDFNNSLLVIWSALDELTFLGPLPKAIEPALAAMRAAAEQAAATTKQLRAFGPTALQKSADLALGPVIAKTKTMLARILPQNLELVADVGPPVVISADEGEVLRVITNLALNARDAMRDGGKLTLRLRGPRDGEPKTATTGGAYVVLDVEDTGSGMSDDVKARLFEPYFTTKQASGTGLGLASVRDALERAGGEVRVESTLGHGTVISLFWPEAPSKTELAAATARGTSTRSAVVLVVDDERAVRHAITRSLTRAGMIVLEAEDGASALLVARRHKDKIDVLCTDCVMAGVPVPQLIQRFRELHGGKVVVCSGYAPTETGLSPEMFDDFLSKPFTGEELVGRIRALAG
jgi:signal transduction histidine kinase